jgi:Flp pilus assembly protein TadG
MRRTSNLAIKERVKSSRSLRRFCFNTAGGIAVTFALALPAILAVVGVATDYLTYSLVRTHLQAAADGAAAAGARELAIVGVQDSQIKALVGAYVNEEVDERNGPASHDTLIDKKKYSVTVSLQQNWTPFFAHFLDKDITPVRAGATAVLAGTTNVCVLTLDPKSGKALRLTMLAKLQANGCGVYSNSNSKQGISVELLANLKASLICSAGGVSGLLSKMTPAPTTDCPVLPDPLGKRVPPEVGPCKHTGLKLNNKIQTLLPGTYCGGIEISGTSKIKFAPGTYVIKDGRFRITDKASAEGVNVGFYLTGDASTIDFVKNTTISFSGAKDGAMAGLLLFEDRGAPLGRNHRINSANARELTGTIYLPRGKLQVDPNAAVASDSAYTAIVAYTVELTEGPTLTLNSDYGATDVPVPDGIRVTGKIVLTR